MSLHTLSRPLLATTLLCLFLGACGPNIKSSQSHAEAKKRWAATRGNILYNLAQQQFDSGDLDKAEKTCLEAIEIAPNQASYFELAARIALERGQLERAFHTVDKALKMDDKRPDSHYLMGVILQRWERYEGALTSYETAYRLKPDHIAGLLASAEMLVKMDRTDEAMARLLEKAVYFENNAAIRVSMGRICVLQRRYGEAIHYFTEALVLDPDDARTLEHLAQARQLDGRYAEAITDLNKLMTVEKYAQRSDLQMALGDCLMATGKTNEARTCFLALTERNKQDANAWIKLGQAAWIVGDDVRVGKSAERAMSLAPSRHEGYLLAGMLEQKMGDSIKAVDYFDTASRLAPQSAIPLLLKGMALQKTGQHADAAAAYRQALLIAPDDERAQRLLTSLASPANN